MNCKKYFTEIAQQIGYPVVLKIVSPNNHMLLVDLRSFDITGSKAETALDRAGITVNKNLIPYDPRSPKITSGIRIGTPALTSRGFGLAEMEAIGALIGRVLRAPDDTFELAAARSEAQELANAFPVPGINY